MTQFICPICAKDLGPSMPVLGDPEGVWEMHMNIHISNVQKDIWDYLLKNKCDLPHDLPQLIINRIDTIKKLVIKKHELRDDDK